MQAIEKQKAFLNLYEPHREKLSRFCRALTKNSDDAKDLISETTLKAYENFDSIRKFESFASYLFSIASRTHKRKIWRQKIFSPFSAFQETVDNYKYTGASPDSSLDVEILFTEMKKLPLEQQEALALFEVSGFSIAEIATIQNVSESAVKSRLKRGREKLCKLMNIKDFDNYESKIYKLQSQSTLNNSSSMQNASKLEKFDHSQDEATMFSSISKSN